MLLHPDQKAEALLRLQRSRDEEDVFPAPSFAPSDYVSAASRTATTNSYASAVFFPPPRHNQLRRTTAPITFFPAQGTARYMRRYLRVERAVLERGFDDLLPLHPFQRKRAHQARGEEWDAVADTLPG